MANKYIAGLSVKSFGREYLDLYWEYHPVVDPASVQVTVERSMNQLSEYAQLGLSQVGQSYFRDTNIRTNRGFYHEYYYRLKIRDRRSGDISYYPEIGGASLGPAPDLVALEIARQLSVRLEAIEGRKLLLFQRRKDGARCPHCWDPVLKKRIRSNCLACFGVGILGGYYAPIETYFRIDSTPSTTTQLQEGRVSTENTAFLFSNFPVLGAGDLLVDFENERWLVNEQISGAQRNKAIVNQRGTLTRLPITDVAYRVPVLLTAAQAFAHRGEPAILYVMPSNLQAYAEEMATEVYS